MKLYDAMKCRDDKERKLAAITKWHKKYVWFPTTLKNGDIVWLEDIMCKKVIGFNTDWYEYTSIEK